MWFCVIGDLVTHPGLEHKGPSIRQLGMQLAFEAEQNMSFDAPVIGQITRRVLDHAYTNLATAGGAPVSHTALPAMFNRGNC